MSVSDTSAASNSNLRITDPRISAPATITSPRPGSHERESGSLWPGHRGEPAGQRLDGVPADEGAVQHGRGRSEADPAPSP